MLTLEAEQPEEPKKDRRSRLLRVMAGAAVTLVLVITGAVLMSGGGDSEPDDPKTAPDETERAEAATALPIPTLLEATPTPQPRPELQAEIAEILGRDAVGDAQNRDELGRSLNGLDSSNVDLPPALRNLDFDALVSLGADGWLALPTGLGELTLIDVNTGEYRWFEDMSTSPGAFDLALLAKGVLTTPSFGLSDSDRAPWLWQPWSGELAVELPVAEEAHLVGILDDPEHGPIMLFLDANCCGVDTPAAAVKLATMETQPLLLDPVIAARGVPLDYAEFLALDRSDHPSRFVVGANGRVWSWSWTAGWADDGPGDVLLDSLGEVRAARCADATTCTHWNLTTSGDWVEAPGSGSLDAHLYSPTRARYLKFDDRTIRSADDGFDLGVVESQSGESSSLSFEGFMIGRPVWTSDTTLMVTRVELSSPESLLVNVVTGTTVELPGGEASWLPEVDFGG